MFYFDLDTPVYSPKLQQLIGEMRACAKNLRTWEATARWSECGADCWGVCWDTAIRR